jgi:multiple sugar transport system permease protein
MSTRQNNVGYKVLLVILTIGAITMIMPYLWMIFSSLKSNLEIVSPPATILPKSPSFEGYAEVLKDAPFWKWLVNSLITSTFVTIGVLFSSSMAGYIFAKFKFKGKRIFFVTILATMMVPFQIIMMPIYLIISHLGLVNNIAGIIIPFLVGGFGVFLSKQFIENIPNTLIEAARIDGAGEFQTFYKLILPQIKPILSALAIFTFMNSWNRYLWPLVVLNDMEKMTVPLALVYFNNRHVVQYNVVMSASVLIMMPVIVVFLLFQKQFIKGLTLTGIK